VDKIFWFFGKRIEEREIRAAFAISDGAIDTEANALGTF
jgi:hypothetical protein